jgi:hypothetical protein
MFSCSWFYTRWWYGFNIFIHYWGQWCGWAGPTPATRIRRWSSLYTCVTNTTQRSLNYPIIWVPCCSLAVVLLQVAWDPSIAWVLILLILFRWVLLSTHIGIFCWKVTVYCFCLLVIGQVFLHQALVQCSRVLPVPGKWWHPSLPMAWCS